MPRPAHVWLLLGLSLAACERPEVGAGALPDRSGRFGIFRDLVLFERPRSEGGPFFLDMFETTVADWAAYEADAAGTPVDPALRTDMRPKHGVTLTEVRRFARWRFCRLPRADEWNYASTQGHSTAYPWGIRWVETWANTHGMNRGRVAPVGSFESGRKPGGPYDLIGNVAEWTETVYLTTRDVLDADGNPERVLELPGEYTVAGALGLSCWLPAGLPVPLEWLVMAEDEDLPRLVLGGSYRTSVGQSSGGQISTFPVPVPWLPGRRNEETGARLATSPAEVLRALIVAPVEAGDDAKELLGRFLARHRGPLSVAWRWLHDTGWVARQRGGPLLPFLDAALDR